MNFIYHNHGIVKKLALGRVTGHRHQLLGTQSIVIDKLDSAIRILHRVPFQHCQNLFTDFRALVISKVPVIGFRLRLPEIRYPYLAYRFQIGSREIVDLIGEEGSRGILHIEGNPEVVQLEMPEPTETHFP